MEKTNVMRILDQKKLEYRSHFYGDTGAISGTDVAQALNENPQSVFKTLVTAGKSKKYYVFMVPVCEELDLKKAAKSVTTVIHYTANSFDKIFFSGGRIGCQIEMSFESLRKVIPINTADIIVNKNDL